MSEQAITTSAGTGATSTAGATTGAAAGGEGRSLIPAQSGQQTGSTGQPTGTTGAVAETWWKGWIKEDGSLDKTRLNHLDGDLKDSMAIFARYNKFDDFAKAFAHHARTAREKGLTPLREDANEEEKADYLRRLAMVTGAPDKPEGYGLKSDNPELQKQYGEFAKVFQKHAASPALVKELLALNEQLTAAMTEEYETAQAQEADKRWQAEERALKEAFGPYKAEKLEAAQRGARWMGLDTNSPLFTQNAALIIAAAKVGEKISEAAYVDGNAAQHQSLTPQQELADMTSNPTNKYYDVLRNPGKNPRLFHEAQQRQIALGKLIARQQGG